MSLSEDTKAIVASNLTCSIATLVASGKEEKEAIIMVKELCDSLYNHLDSESLDKPKKLFPNF